MKKLLLLILVIGFASCKESKKPEKKAIETLVENEVSLSKQTHPGKKIMETECYICHNPKASEATMIAPPMIAIKKHYLNENTSKKEFTEALILWLDDPEAPSKMLEAQQRFGKMPYLPYKEETITKIADYLYDYEIEKPEWYNIEDVGFSTIKESENNIAKIGMEYALSTKALLGKNLMKAINENGTVGALEFCNIKAMPLTDSISVMNNTAIKRVSDKPRNQNNNANKNELDYINHFKKVVAADGELTPVVQPENGEINFYYPIITNNMCLQCHGKPNEHIKTETLTMLKQLYPNDKATDYQINEVRGIWAINFDDTKKE